MQKMKLDPICAALADMVRSLYHHLQRLAGKAQDHMSNYMKIKAFELLDGVVKLMDRG